MSDHFQTFQRNNKVVSAQFFDSVIIALFNHYFLFVSQINFLKYAFFHFNMYLDISNIILWASNHWDKLFNQDPKFFVEKPYVPGENNKIKYLKK